MDALETEVHRTAANTASHRNRLTSIRRKRGRARPDRPLDTHPHRRRARS